MTREPHFSQLLRQSSGYQRGNGNVRDKQQLPDDLHGSAFAGQYLVPVSDSFPLDGYSVVGDVMTLDCAGGNPMMGQTLTAAFDVAPVPEPSIGGSLSISVLAALAVFFARNLRPKSLRS